MSAAKTDNKPSIMVEVYNGNTAKTINTLFPWFKITNTGNAPLPLSDISARYYYTVDGNKKQQFWCDWCSKGNTSIVTGKFSTIKSNAYNIDTCFEVGFKNEKIMLQPGESVEVHIRIAKEDWSNFNQENDYSFNSSAKTYVPQVKVPGFIKGKLVWGNDPAVAIVDDASIQLDRNELTLKVSETARLKATIVPSDISDKDIIWYSSDIHVAAVDKNGLVIGINEGTAIITASTADGSIKDTCSVRVIKADARGVLEGRIRDAVTHAEISGADISFYRETGKDYQITGSATSDSQGLFRISLPVGNYKAVVSKGKYISAVYY
ncbi:MAG TPA: cellulose binding domain-containing protein, partial [Parasegetibacter sp.]